MKTYYHKKGSENYEMRSRRSFPSSSVKGLGRHGRSQGYGQDKYPGMTLAKEIFEGRSARSRAQDLARFATITKDVTVWLKAPNRFDLQGIDTPSAQAIFDKRSVREKAQDLARRAKKTKNLELWAGNVNRYDFDKIDTPGAKGKHVHKFRVVPKEEAKKLEMKSSESKEAKEKKHTLPSKAEILERAQAIHTEKELKAGLPAQSAEENELKESGDFEAARTELMSGVTSKADSQVLEYVHNINSELEPFGFKVVEID